MNSRITLAATFLAALALSGCASAPKADPWEGMNRATFAFNDAVDAAVIKPVAQGYEAVTPEFVRSGVSNLFANLTDVTGALNSLLQGKPVESATSAGRFVVNSTLGILGLFDIATPMGLDRHEEDLGQTLGVWGVGSGPYFVIPLMGPSSLRDVAFRGVDSYLGWTRYVDHVPTRNSVFGLQFVQTRASLLGASQTLEEAALDKYQFLRDAYLQRRLRAVYDGKAPQEALDKLEEDLEPPKPPARPMPPAPAKTDAPDQDKK